MSKVDDYIEEVVKKGDEGSKLLAAMCAPTLKNSDYVEVLRPGMNGIAVLRIPGYYKLAVHSACGEPSLWNPEDHSRSMVDRLVGEAHEIGARPVAFMDVIDSRNGSEKLVRAIGSSLASSANRHKISILNGELAIIEDRLEREVL